MSGNFVQSTVTVGYIGHFEENVSCNVFSQVFFRFLEKKGIELMWVATNKVPRNFEFSYGTLFELDGATSAVARNFILERWQSEHLIMLDADMKLNLERLDDFICFLKINKICTAAYTDYFLNSDLQTDRLNGVELLNFCGGFIGLNKSLVKDLRYDEDMDRMQDVLFSFQLIRMSGLKKICVFPKALFTHLTVNYSADERFKSLTIRNFYMFRGLLFMKQPLIACYDISMISRIFLILGIIFLPYHYFLILYIVLTAIRVFRMRDDNALQMVIKSDIGFIYGINFWLFSKIGRILSRVN